MTQNIFIKVIKTTSCSSVSVVEQVITDRVICLKQIVLYLSWTSDDWPYLVSSNIETKQRSSRVRRWVVLVNFGLFYDFYYLYYLFFLTIFVSLKDIQSQVTFSNIDSFKVLVLFPLHIPSKYQEYASYVNTDKNNTILTSIETKRIKLKEGSVSRSTKICKRELQNKESNLLDESSKDTLLSKGNNNDI